MTKILNKDAFKLSIDSYAIQLGFKRADGSAKPISKLTSEALELAIITYIINDSRLKELLDES